MEKKKRGSNSYVIKPVTLGFLLLVYIINLFIADRAIYIIMLLTGALTLAVINKEKLTKAVVSFFVLVALTYSINTYFKISGWIGSIFTMLIIILRIYPVWLLAMALSTYNTSALMNSLRNLSISNNLAIAVAVFFRFLPDYKEYMKDIRESLKVRNIAFKWNKPLESFELYLVPMIYKAFQTGEILTCSLITKGIECECKKTSYFDLRLTSLDYLFMLFGICLLVVTIWTNF